MKVDIVRKNFELSEKLSDVIHKKTGKLAKYFGDDTTVKVLLSKENDDCKMEITVAFNGLFIRSELAGDSMYDIIDDLLPKIEKQVVRHKEKLHKKLKAGAFTEPDFLFLETEPDHKRAEVVKEKKFAVLPLSTEDAIDQMAMLDHDFFVYLDEKTQALKIVYRRSDGNVGILEPLVQ